MENESLGQLEERPLLSVITPAYNEALIIEKNINRLVGYLNTLEDRYRWEIIIVNDGSRDNTGELADKLEASHPNIRAIHHKTNKNLGKALQTGFKHVKGTYVVVLDIDLSYHESHIETMLEVQKKEDADIVIASPYMKGGKNTAVPRDRLIMSRVVNYTMKKLAPGNISTFTGMVRLYHSRFLTKLNLKSGTYSINPEIIQKAIILRAKIVEIPAHLDWSDQKNVGRTSSIRIFKGIIGGLMSGFIFRPYIFYMTVGGTLLLLALYIIAWVFINTFALINTVPPDITGMEPRFSAAVGMLFNERPYSFFIGGICLIVALQFFSVGFLSLQNKRYFDELFHLNSNVLELLKKGEKEPDK